MITNAIWLSLLTFVGFIVVFNKSPRMIRSFIWKHTLLADITAMAITYVVLGGSVTGMMSAALIGIFVSTALAVCKNSNTEPVRIENDRA